MSIQDLIIQKHLRDQDQLDVIFSRDKSIVVTAPAGCGKTTTMISKIAWELSSGNIAHNKRILAMTYSVAGAMRIRESLKTLLPSLVNNPDSYLRRVDVSNYHQFAMKLLRRYGSVLHKNLMDVNDFEIVDENNRVLILMLIDSELRVFHEFNEAIKNSDKNIINKHAASYWEILENKLIPAKLITYNGILITAIKLLQESKEIREFYQKYYQMIIVDEFQDTNYLGYFFLCNLIGDNRTVFMGDDIQRIYGFIGAINDLFIRVKHKYNSKEYYLKTNYRFPANPYLRALDELFRDYGENYHPSELNANLYFRSFDSDNKELAFVADGITTILKDSTNKVAVLVRAGYQGYPLAMELERRRITYFNSLYKETDDEYKKFYQVAYEEFHNTTHNNKALMKDLKTCFKSVKSREKDIVTNENNRFIFISLLKLMKILFEQAKQWNCSPEERFNQIDFTLGNNGLKHMMEYMDERVVLSTIHSAKGLEWQYIIIPGLVSYGFPPSPICRLCRDVHSNCNQGYNYCENKFNQGMEKVFKEEISVLYVALTRARKNVFFTASNGVNQWNFPKRTSCLMNLPGLKMVDYAWENCL